VYKSLIAKGLNNKYFGRMSPPTWNKCAI